MDMPPHDQAALNHRIHMMRETLHRVTGAELLCVMAIGENDGLYVLAPKDVVVSPLAMQRAEAMVDAIAFVNHREDKRA